MTHPTIAVLDFGSQYTQLIARRIREEHVHSVLVRPDASPELLRELNAVGVVLSGGPASAYADDGPQPDPGIFEADWPVLGICYGMQAGCQAMGATVTGSPAGEFGRTTLSISQHRPLFRHLPAETTVWMSHGDVVSGLGSAFETLASTPTCPFAAVKHRERPFYGLQFHPEVTHTSDGHLILRNFLFDVCGCKPTWQVGQLIEEAIALIRGRVGADERVICALSGGVDSSVVAALLHEAVGERLVCIFVDNGLLRKNERELVEATFRDHFHMDLHVVDAGAAFLKALVGVTDPQEKRRIIGHEFIEVFRREADSIDNAKYLAQGTLYPDVVESGHNVAGTAASIKLHHNVGGLPAELGFELIEPLRDLFKDEVRRMGEHLGLPEEIIWRHPFPGPGLAVRVVGEITPKRLDVLRKADRILIDELRAANWYNRVSQALAVLLPVSAVGVMGDGRTYEDQQVVAIRLVETKDFMTADWVRIDAEVLARVSTRIVNEVRGVNRVVYDISSKPPATIEWE